MESLYGQIPDELVAMNLDDLIDQIFRLLPLKEEDADLNYDFSTVLFRIRGLTHTLNSSPELITVMSMLDAAKTEKNFRLYRKAILDSCSILKNLQGRINAGTV